MGSHQRFGGAVDIALLPFHKAPVHLPGSVQCGKLLGGKVPQGGLQLVQQLLEYVRTHYADYELSVGALALKFGLSDRRLSALIREETGLSFSDYLEKTRVDRALELLQKISQQRQVVYLVCNSARV